MRTVNPVKAEARRRQILDAALGCFKEKGFHATSIAEICAAGQISAGGLYRYFGSKDEIIAAMAEEEHVQVDQLLRDMAETDSFEGALDVMLAQFANAHADRSNAVLAAELVAEAVRNPQFADVARKVEAGMIDSIATLLRSWQGAGHVDPALDPREAANVLLAATDGLGMRLTILGGYDPKEAAAALRTLALRYLQNPVSKIATASQCPQASSQKAGDAGPTSAPLIPSSKAAKKTAATTPGEPHHAS